MLVLDGKMRRKILETIRKLFQTDRYHRGLVVRTELKFWIEWFTQACQFTLNLLCTGLNKTPYKNNINNNNNTSWITYDLNQCTESLLTTIVSVLNSFVHIIYYQSDFSTLNHIDLTCFNAFLNLFTCFLSRAASPSFYTTRPYIVAPASSHLLLFASTGITKKKLANDLRKSKANFMVAQNRNSLDVFDLAKVLWAYFVPVYLEFLRNVRSSSNIDDDDNDKILNTQILKHFFRFPDHILHLSPAMDNTDAASENAYSLNDSFSRLLNEVSGTFLDNLMSGDNNSVNNNNNNPPFSGEYYELDVTLNTSITSSLYRSLKLSNYSNISISPSPLLYDEQDRDEDLSSLLIDAKKGGQESADIPQCLRVLFTILYRSNVLSNYYLTTHSQLPHQEFSSLSSSSMHNHKGVGFGHKLHQQHSNDVTTVLETTLSSKKQALEQAVAFLEYQFNVIKRISLSDDNNHTRQNLIKSYLIGLYLEREFKSGNLTVQQRGFDATTTPTTTDTLLQILPILQSLRNYYYFLMVNSSSSSSYVKILTGCHESAPDAVKLYYELISNVIYLGLSSGSTSSWLLLGRKNIAVLEPTIPIPRAIIKPLLELEERDGAVDGHVEEPGKSSTPATPLQSPVVVVVKHHYHSMERPKLKLFTIYLFTSLRLLLS